MKRSRLKPMSAKRAAEREDRVAVRERALRRAGYRCQAEGIAGLRCGGPLDVDEIILRSGRPGGHLEDDNVQVLCRQHHDWKHTHPTEAVAAGLRRWSWDHSEGEDHDTDDEGG